ncbi:hypothetical protein CYMTET_35411 [Cymbomonas tetramitiformis]|uniref:SET domain-containing protein n=1 Tax=Cymbomonas tetramitiformis TaxID=36881 RepID=A0AAE0F9D5_9CHLO|nr:hypothetical protein CYMTET_35411 [Cymbomonas tetramitiformis]
MKEIGAADINEQQKLKVHLLCDPAAAVPAPVKREEDAKPAAKKSKVQEAEEAWETDHFAEARRATAEKAAMDELASQLPGLHTKLRGFDEHGTFAAPVTDDIAPNYSKIIHHPMDLGTMRKKLGKGKYRGGKTWQEGFAAFTKDVELMCKNCMKYNGDGEYYQEGEKLLVYAQDLLGELEQKLERITQGSVARARKAAAGSNSNSKPSGNKRDDPEGGKRKGKGEDCRDMAAVGAGEACVRPYTLIEDYVPVGDEEEVEAMMACQVPDEQRPVPEFEDEDTWLPREVPYTRCKELGQEVLEQDVFGMDVVARSHMLAALQGKGFSEKDAAALLEDRLLPTINRCYGKLTAASALTHNVTHAATALLSEENLSKPAKTAIQRLKTAAQHHPEEYAIKHKGHGVVCAVKGGMETDEFLVDLLGEVYPPWRWCEKQDAIRKVAADHKIPADEVPEFYNMMLERPKGDANGYAVVVVDAMSMSNYSSRLSHSCNPNCEVRVRAVDGKYRLMMFLIRPVAHGEELTYNYNTITDSLQEFKAAVCLCGTRFCFGNYLSYAGGEAYKEVIGEELRMSDRHAMLLEACTKPRLGEEDLEALQLAGWAPRRGMLVGLPPWALKYVALLLAYVRQERSKLPRTILQARRKEAAQAPQRAGGRKGAPAPYDEDEDDEDCVGDFTLEDANIEAQVCLALPDGVRTTLPGCWGHAVLAGLRIV